MVGLPLFLELVLGSGFDCVVSSVDVLDSLAQVVVAELRHVGNEPFQDVQGNGGLLCLGMRAEGGQAGWLWQVLHPQNYYRNSRGILERMRWVNWGFFVPYEDRSGDGSKLKNHPFRFEFPFFFLKK